MNLGKIWSTRKPTHSINRSINNVVRRPPPPSSNNMNVNKPSTRSFWGSATWFFFHTIASRINANYYMNNCEYVWNFIKLVCFHLPCPHCKLHATNYVKNTPLTKVNTREKLEKYLFDFHNTVNSRTHKSIEGMSILQKYKQANVKKIFDLFEQRYFFSYIGRRHFDDWKKNEVKAEYYKFYNNVRTKFD